MRTRRVIRERRHDGPDAQAEFVEIAPGELAGMFNVPNWLRNLGVMAWLLVGVTVLIAGTIWLLALTNTIVIPVVTASIIAAVLSPLVRRLQHRGVPRGAGAALVFVGVIAAGVGLTLLIVAGITSQTSEITGALKSAATKLQSTLQDAGVSADAAKQANVDASAGVSSAFHALLGGLGTGVKALGSLAIFASFTALSLFFLLKDGPQIRDWLERHMGLPHAVGQMVGERMLQALRGYFAGVTAVAAFNGVVIGLGALVLGVPMPGTIAVVNFVAAYIPYLGAWSAGAFTVLIALGAKGSSTALIMAVIILLANGALQQLIQPIAYGAALGIHPLAVLIVTIAGGALFGTIGLVLAAPLTSAATHIAADVARARAAEAQPPPETVPA
ncbi:AI-2E family transporter [Solirubrobacter soli]|uniref:AI-2E family transporter n=1 Tax=Solirubrobacter soli TaxID=363832 RepID=UPI00041619DF|nr:AI-2E family transporter [Solirubrobacter soli]